MNARPRETTRSWLSCDLLLRAGILLAGAGGAAFAQAGCARCSGDETAVVSTTESAGAPAAAASARATATGPTKAPFDVPLDDATTGRPDFDAARAPHVRLEAVTVTSAGRLAEAVVRGAATSLLKRADACLVARLADKPGLRGTVRLDVRLAPAPAAPAVTATHSGEDARLQECLAAAFGDWPADARPGAGEEAVALTLSLHAGLKLPTTRPSLPPPPTLPPALPAPEAP